MGIGGHEEGAGPFSPAPYVRLFRIRPDTGVRSHLSAGPDLLELGGLPLLEFHGFHLLLTFRLYHAGSSSETCLLLRRVACATLRSRHPCLVFRQREDKESVSGGRPEHSGYEPFGPSAPPD